MAKETGTVVPARIATRAARPGRGEHRGVVGRAWGVLLRDPSVEEVPSPERPAPEGRVEAPHREPQDGQEDERGRGHVPARGGGGHGGADDEGGGAAAGRSRGPSDAAAPHT